jgi:hypothetical protein
MTRACDRCGLLQGSWRQWCLRCASTELSLVKDEVLREVAAERVRLVGDRPVVIEDQERRLAWFEP